MSVLTKLLLTFMVLCTLCHIYDNKFCSPCFRSAICQPFQGQDLTLNYFVRTSSLYFITGVGWAFFKCFCHIWQNTSSQVLVELCSSAFVIFEANHAWSRRHEQGQVICSSVLWVVCPWLGSSKPWASFSELHPQTSWYRQKSRI